MNIKKIVIPTITLIVLTSQLMGCQSVTQDEFIQMVKNSEAIEIEVAAPSAEAEQGTSIQLDWTQLDQLQTQPNLRKDMDTLFKIVPYGTNSKNGVFYINLQGEQEGNNTLYNAFANSSFRKAWTDEDNQETLATKAAENYADIEADNISEACLAALNGYFNILEDAEGTEGYANMDSTITRLEAMSAVFKAENPVTDKLTEDKEFNKLVDPDNKNYNTIYASNLSEQSYLDIDSKSLDELTANGTITRGELVYLIVQQYFSDDYKNVDIKKAEVYSDVKNAGNLAEKLKATDKDHYQAYELTYTLQNPADGCPERMYKALAVAKQHSLIVGDESRWDEGATKEDLLEILTNAYMELAPQTKDSLGKGDGKALEIEDSKASESSSVETNIAGYDEKLPDYEQTYMTFEDIEPTVMVAVKDVVMYANPNMTEGKLMTDGSILTGEERTITAKGTFEGKNYWAYKNDNNRWFIIEEDALQVKGQEQQAEEQTEEKAEEKAEPTEAPADTSASSDNSGGQQSAPQPTTPPAAPQQTAPQASADDIFGGQTTDDVAWDTGSFDNWDGEGVSDDAWEAADGFTIE